MEALTPSTFYPTLSLFSHQVTLDACWKIFRLYLNCLPCSLALTTLSNGLCIGGTCMVHNIQHYWTWPCLSRRGRPPSSHPAEKRVTGMRLSVSFSMQSLFNSLHSIASALPSPFSRHSGTQSLSPQITVSIYEGGENQYNTKQWLIGLRVRCAERSLLYIMYGGQLMVSVLADKWTVSISPVWWSHRGDAHTHTHMHTHTRTNTKL